MAYRLKGRSGYSEVEPFYPTFHSDRLLEPYELKKPAKIFVCSMGELFGPEIPEIWQAHIMTTVFHCPQHQFLVLTKCPENIPRYEEAEAYWPSNLWLGVSVDGVANGQQLIDDLFDADFPHHKFVSFEPLIGKVKDLSLDTGIDWVIIGAQTGIGAKQPRKEWIHSILLEASEYEVPVFVKDNVHWIGERPQDWPKENDKNED